MRVKRLTKFRKKRLRSYYKYSLLSLLPVITIYLGYILAKVFFIPQIH